MKLRDRLRDLPRYMEHDIVRRSSMEEYLDLENVEEELAKADPCEWPGCPAQAANGEYCTVHRPEGLVDRLRAIVTDRIFRAAAPLPVKYQRLLVTLQRDIMNDLESIRASDRPDPAATPATLLRLGDDGTEP